VQARETFGSEELLPDTPEALARRMRTFAQKSLDGGGPRLGGVGIGVSGDVSLNGARVLRGFLPSGTELIPPAERELGVSVLVDNDANLAVLGECILGAGRELSNVVCMLDRGWVGTGLVLNGSLYRGANNAAGELCASTLSGEGRSEWPGIEAVPFVESLGLERAIQAAGCGLSREQFDSRAEMVQAVMRAAAADDTARALVEGQADRFARALYRLAVLFDPQLVVLGGDWCVGGTEAEQTLRKRFEGLWYGSGYARGVDAPQFCFSRLGQDAVALGGAAMAIDMLSREVVENGNS